jgi:hypothetical protein
MGLESWPLRFGIPYHNARFEWNKNGEQNSSTQGSAEEITDNEERRLMGGLTQSIYIFI